MSRKRKVRGTVNRGDSSGSTLGITTASLATAAAIDSSAFAKINATESIPATWEDRARKAWEYYLEEPLVKNCINSWRTFAVGDEIRVTSDDETLKGEAEDLADRLDLTSFVKDMLLQLLVKGDAVGFRSPTKDGRDLDEIVCVNPVSIRVKYAHGELVDVRQFKEDGPTQGEGLPLPVEQVLHLKWDAPSFSPRGNSLVLPAFQSIELLRDYRRAEQAIAKRWATPFRLIKVGGAYGPKLVMPDQKMLEQVRDMVNKMDMKSGLVVPFYVTVETHGTEGQVLNVEEKVKEVKEDIVVALGLSRSLVSGDGPNFATASVSLQKMLVMIREIKHAAARILDWIFDDWRDRRGYGDKAIHYLWNDLDPTDAVDVKRLLLELYDRRLISRSSLQIKMDLDPDVEEAAREKERGQFHLFDEKQVKPFVDMVTAGIMTVPVAQEILGLDPAKNSPESTLPDGELSGSAARVAHAGEICDSCSHFDGDRNLCRVHREPVAFDSPACRFLSRRTGA